MNLLIFSDKDPIGFQSRRQLGWLFEFIKDNHKEVNVKMLDSFDDSEKKLSYDLYYLRNFSIWLDFLIFFKTIRLVFLRRGSSPLK